MTFDKDEYWKNRKAGKRGQGEPTKIEVTDDAKSGEHMVQVGTSLSFVNRQTARRQANVRNRYYAGKDDSVGKPFTAKGVRHSNGRKEFEPSQDPNETNHQRVLRQRKLRALRKDQKRLRELAEKDAE